MLCTAHLSCPPFGLGICSFLIIPCHSLVIRSGSRQTLPWFWLGVESFFPIRFPCRRPVSSSVLAELASDESLSGVEWDDKQRAPRGRNFWASWACSTVVEVATAVLMAGHSHRITDPLSKPRNSKSENPFHIFQLLSRGYSKGPSCDAFCTLQLKIKETVND
jgi:hypothetical protein